LCRNPAKTGGSYTSSKCKGKSTAYLEQVSTTVPKSAILRFCPKTKNKVIHVKVKKTFGSFLKRKK